MALTIKMRIDEQPEHSYVFSTGDGGQIELIPLSVVQNGSYTAPDGKAYNIVTVNVPETELEHLNITANGTYTAEDGTAYDVVTVNVQPILEAVTRSYTENGTYTIIPSEGNDGISGVTVTVNVPTPQPQLETKTVSYDTNGTYSVVPSTGYDGLASVSVEVDVPTGGGDTEIITLTLPDTTQRVDMTPNVPNGKHIKSVSLCLQEYTSLPSTSVARGVFFGYREYLGEESGVQRFGYMFGYRTNATSSTLSSASGIGNNPTTIPATASGSNYPLLIYSDTNIIHYFIKASTETQTIYGFMGGENYRMVITYEDD